MEIREAIRREARIKRIPFSTIREEMDDLYQEVKCEVLTWIDAQGGPETLIDVDVLEKQTASAAQRVVRHWLEQRKRTTTLGEIRPDAIVYALCEEGELPAWVPENLRDVAAAIVETAEESTAVGEPGRLPYAELEARLGISHGTLVNRVKALRQLRIPDRRLEWYSAASEDYRAQHPVSEPWYVRTGSTPMRLGDIPGLVEKPDCGDDQINLLSDRADELAKSIWEGLTVCLFAASRLHGQQYDARLQRGENWASCGVDSRD